MKAIYFAMLCLFITAGASAQKKEKIKGTKVVTVTQKEVPPFDMLEVEDNIEVFLVKGTVQAIKIEADDNLHESIQADINGTVLRLYTNKEITGAKKITVRITYTGELKSITAKHQVILYALTELELENIAVKNVDYRIKQIFIYFALLFPS